MKRKILIFTAFLLILLAGFTSCKEKEKTYNLIGDWVNEKNDTLTFMSTSWLHLSLFFSDRPYPEYGEYYEYYVEKDYILLLLSNESNLDGVYNQHDFEYSKEQIKIGSFNHKECDIYKRLK